MTDDNDNIEEEDDFNAIFRQMTEDLDLDLPQITATTVATLKDIELMSAFNSTRRELQERRELLHPTTEIGKDLQAQYHAYLLEMRRRKLR